MFELEDKFKSKSHVLIVVDIDVAREDHVEEPEPAATEQLTPVLKHRPLETSYYKGRIRISIWYY